MKVLNKISVALLISAVAITSAFGSPEAYFKPSQKAFECQSEGNYKIRVKNDFPHKYPFPVGRRVATMLLAGEEFVFEMSREELEMEILGWFKLLGIDLDLVESNEKIFYISDEKMPEHERFSMTIVFCFDDEGCSIKNKAYDNCEGVLDIRLIDGHPFSKDELLKSGEFGKMYQNIL